MFEIDTVAFDMDGTLLDSRQLAIEAVQASMHERRRHEERLEIPEAESIVGALGNPSDEFYEGFLPEWAFEEHLLPFRRRAFEIERDILEAGKGKLFDGVLDTLAAIKQSGFRLVLVSNCGEGYLNAVISAFKLDRFLDRAMCIGGAGAKRHKNDILGQALRELGSRKALMVGDRIHDLEAARVNACHFAAAIYGFGQSNELAGCDVELHNVRKLPELIRPFE